MISQLDCSSLPVIRHLLRCGSTATIALSFSRLLLLAVSLLFHLSVSSILFVSSFLFSLVSTTMGGMAKLLVAVAGLACLATAHPPISQFRRAVAVQDCGAKRGAIQKDLNDCTAFASKALEEAEGTGSSKYMELFFKSSSPAAKEKVANMFRKIVEECKTVPGRTKISCVDTTNTCQANTCQGNTAAYARSPDSGIWLCERYFQVDRNARKCGSPGPAIIMIYEMSHAQGSTEDLSGYGMATIKSHQRR